MFLCSSDVDGDPGSTRQWYMRGKFGHSPVSTQLVLMVTAANSRQAPKPGEPISPKPYWQYDGNSKTFAVDILFSGRLSISVSGIFLIKIRVPQRSPPSWIDAAVPPILVP